jgi:hypothetical protein
MIVLVVPPLGMKKSVYEALLSNFNVAEQYRANLQTLSFTGTHKRSLLLVHSFEGLPLQTTQSVKYYVNLKENTKPDDIAKNVYLQEDY